MATYLKGITDVVPQITPFTPDFGMLQKTLSALQSRYEQGFASVKNAYNQVLNAPLSDAMNQATRDKFVKEAEEKLKNLSSVDLSLPENQATAENVFAPFWEDSLMVQDAGVTKWYQGELQKAMATRESQDEKIRSQYSDAAVRYLQNGLEKLQTAGRDPNKYAKLEKRRFVPFQNMKAYLNEQAEKAKMEIVWESAEGPYLVKREGGPRAIPAFETFAENMLGDQFQDQFRVMGVVDKEERIRQKKQYNPSLTDEQAMIEISKEVGTEYKKGLTSRFTLLQKQLGKVEDDMKQYTSLKILDTKQAAELGALTTQQLQLQGQFDATKLQMTDANTAAFQDNVLQNSDSYFTNIMRQRAVKGWANARAGSEKVTATINPAWTENLKMAQTQREFEFKAQEMQIKTRQLQLNEWIAEHPYAKQGPRLGTGFDDNDLLDGGGLSGSTGFSGGGGSYSGGYSSMDPEKAGIVESVDAVNPTKVDNPYQLYQERQLQRWGIAHQQLFDDRAAGAVMKSMGVSTPDVVNYMRALKNYSMDLSGKSLSKQEHGWLHDLSTKLTGKEVPTYAGFFQLRTKLLEGMQTSLENKVKEGGPGLTNEDTDMLFSYLDATYAIQEHDDLEEQRKKLVQEKIIGNPETYSKILTQKNGKYDVADVDDIVKDFKPLTVWDGDKRRTFTARELAEFFVNGQLDYRGGDAIFLEGRKAPYRIAEFNGQSDKNFTDSPAKAFASFYSEGVIDSPNSIMHKYGTSQKQKDLRDKLNAAVVPNLPQYQSETGRLGVTVRYDLGEKGKLDVGTRLIQEAGQEGNHLGIYVNGELSKDDDINKAIMQVMGLGADDVKDYVSTALLKTIGPTGRPTLQVVLKPVSSKDNTKISETDLKTLTGLKTIEFELNPDAKGPMLQKIRYNTGMDAYGSIGRGKPMLADPILKAAGFDCTISPDDPYHPTQAIVEVKRKEFVNGAYVDAPVVTQRYSLTNITTGELVRNLHLFAKEQINKNLKAQQAYQKQVGSTGQGMTPAQVMEQVRKQYGR